MPVIAVVNRKGGSGKSTLATHLATHLSSTGASVLLGDIDRQQSTRTWLRQRNAAAHAADIKPWAVDPRFFARPPAGADHVVLDTPGGLTGLDLARVVMYADAILVPVCSSLFDRESAADCVTELRTLPRVASGRCRLAAVGMRVDPRTEAAGVVQRWATEQRLSLVAVLRESNAYVRCIEKGLTLFDLPSADVDDDLAQWQPIIAWLRPIVKPAAAESRATEEAAIARETALREHRAPRAETRAPTVHASRACGPRPQAAAPAVNPMSRLLEALPIPRFLQRTP